MYSCILSSPPWLVGSLNVLVMMLAYRGRSMSKRFVLPLPGIDADFFGDDEGEDEGSFR